MSPLGTFRTCRDGGSESVMRPKADIPLLPNDLKGFGAFQARCWGRLPHRSHFSFAPSSSSILECRRTIIFNLISSEPFGWCSHR